MTVTRVVEVLALLVVTQCVPAGNASIEGPASLDGLPPPDEAEAVTISGRLHAHDGSMLEDADVVIVRVGMSSQKLRPRLDRDGSFSITVPPGVYRISIDAPDHRAISRTTVVVGNLSCAGRLRGSARLEAEGARPPEPLEWSGESPTTKAVRHYHARWSPQVDALRRRIPDEKNVFTMSESMRAEARALARRARADIDPRLPASTRGLLRAEHLALFYVLSYSPEDAAAELKEDLAAVVQNAHPTDLHFALTKEFLNFQSAVGTAKRGADEALVARTSRWLERQARTHPVPLVAAGAVGRLMAEAKQRKDANRLAELEAFAASPRFAETDLQRTRRRRGRPGTLQVGQAVAAFDFPALDGGAGRVSSLDRRGRLYLIDMWSTTCRPCVKSMPELHKAYAAANGVELADEASEADLRGLPAIEEPRMEFVSVAIDVGQDVDAFRRESWSMPWTHAVLGQEGLAQLWELFGVGAIPAWVIVDSSGVVLEVGGTLKPDSDLETALKRALERP